MSTAWSRIGRALFSPNLLWLLVVLGVAARVAQYAANRSLWLDESFLALNIIDRNMGSLLTDPLDFNQTAPGGFLFVEKVGVGVFDKGEYTLRALPLVCGIAALLLYPLLARRVAGPAAALIAVSLFALSGPLIYYSSELKPYAGDVVATIAISLMAVAALDDRLSIRRALAFGFLGAVLIQITYAGILAAAGTGAALAVIFAVKRRRRRLGPVIALVGTWAAGAVVFLIARPGLESEQFTRGEGRLGRFAPFPASKADVTWYVDRVRAVVGPDANFPLGRWPDLLLFILGVVAIAGIVTLLRTDWSLLAILVAPVAATIAASAAHTYPLLARTMVFFVPLLFLLVAVGIVALTRRLPAVVGVLAAALAAVALVAEVSFGGSYNPVQPVRRAEIKDSLTYVAERWRTGDVLYIHYASKYAFGYYSECGCFRLPGNRTMRAMWPVRRLVVRDRSRQWPLAFTEDGPSVIVGSRRPVSNPGPLPFYPRDAALIARHRRAWILVTFNLGTRELGHIDRELFRPLDRRGQRVTTRVRDGTRIYLYEFSRP